MKKFTLEIQEQIQVKNLLNEILLEYGSNYECFIKNSSILATELPYNLRQFIHNFKVSIDDNDRACLISQLPINNTSNTPLAINYTNLISEINKDEMLLLLIGSLLGDVFGWKEEQGGNLVHDVMPIPEHKNKQISTGAYQDIYLHTEEAFHDYSSDYLGLLCIRNNQGVPTTYCSINSIDFSDPKFDVLFEKKYLFKKVESHKSLSCNSDFEKGYRKSVLFGDRQKPFIRIDYYFMDDSDDDLETKNVLKMLISVINLALKKIVLQSGDLLLLDNMQCVHGRDAFKPNYDGQDRWLKRINITRDLYKSRNNQNSLMSRVVT